MKTKNIMLSLLVIPFIIGCNENTSNDEENKETTKKLENSTSQQNTKFAKITGSIPSSSDTLIEAYCEDESYARLETIADTNNTTQPFDLEIPTNVNCKLVVTTNYTDPQNRIVTAINFKNLDANGTSFNIENDLELNELNLTSSYNEINDENQDHLSDTPLVIEVNSTTLNLSDQNITDSDHDGTIDAYNDDDNNGVLNAFEDDDNDGVENHLDDDNNNHKPDYLEDDNNDGKINHKTDTDNNGIADYVEDDDGDHIKNHLDSDRDGNGIEDEVENRNHNEDKNEHTNKDNENHDESNHHDDDD